MEQTRNTYLDSMSEKFLDAYDDLSDIGSAPTPDQKEDYENGITRLTSAAVELLKLNVPHSFNADTEKITMEVSGKPYTIDAGCVRGIFGEEQFDAIFGIEKPKAKKQDIVYDAETMKELMSLPNSGLTPESIKSIQDIMAVHPLLGSMAAMNAVMFATASEEAKKKAEEVRDDDSSGQILSDLADVRTRVRHFAREKAKVEEELEATKKALAEAQERLASGEKQAEKVPETALAKERENFKAQTDHLRSQIASLTANRDALQKKTETLTARIHELETADKASAELTDKLHQAETQYIELQKKMDAMQNDYELKLRTANAKYSDLAQRMAAAKTDYDRQLGTVKSDYDKQLANVKADYDRQLSAARSSSAKQQQIQGDMNALRAENKKLAGDLSAAQNKINDLQKAVNDLNDSHKRLRDMAFNDAKTGTLTDMALARDFSKIAPDTSALAVVGIHGTKEINTQYGRKAGDRMLRAAAEYAANTFPDANIYRWMGDRFVVLVPNATDDVKNHLADRLDTLVKTMGADAIDISYGIADGSKLKDWNEMIETAEKGMLDSKAPVKEEEIVPEEPEVVDTPAPSKDTKTVAQDVTDDDISSYLDL